MGVQYVLNRTISYMSSYHIAWVRVLLVTHYIILPCGALVYIASSCSFVGFLLVGMGFSMITTDHSCWILLVKEQHKYHQFANMAYGPANHHVHTIFHCKLSSYWGTLMAMEPSINPPDIICISTNDQVQCVQPTQAYSCPHVPSTSQTKKKFPVPNQNISRKKAYCSTGFLMTWVP